MSSKLTVYSDLNVRLAEVNPNDQTLIYDVETIKQSLIRLTTTEEGEIPYFRAYGLNLNQFLQSPLTESTGLLIYKHVVEKISTFETRVNTLDDYSKIIINYEIGAIQLIVAVQPIKVNQIIEIPTITIPTGI